MKKVLFIGERFLLRLPSVFLVISFVFLLLHILPGDPVELLLGEASEPSQVISLKESLGFNKSLAEQYLRFWEQLIRKGGGDSLIWNRPAGALIVERLIITCELALPAFVLASFFSVFLALLSLYFRHTWLEIIISTLSYVGRLVPVYCLAPALIYFFSYRLGWFPISGRGAGLSAVLPIVTLVLLCIGPLVKSIRAALLEHFSEDFVRTARAKGLSEMRVLCIHVLQTSWFPILNALLGLLGALLGGLLVLESIFDWPGLGSLVLTAFQTRDYILIQSFVVWSALVHIFTAVLIEVIASQLDPRLQLKEGY